MLAPMPDLFEQGIAVAIKDLYSDLVFAPGICGDGLRHRRRVERCSSDLPPQCRHPAVG